MDQPTDQSDLDPVVASESSMATPAGPTVKTRLPDPEQAEVTHYAYDPQTYEILCRPGQRPSVRKAQRLQELGLYAHVVTFAE
jgi:hypothetical protein